MTVKLLPTPQVPMERLARITTDDYHAMLEAGILKDGDPIELLDGVLVYKDRSASGGNPMTIGERHNIGVQLLSDLNSLLTPFGCSMQTQGPVTLPPYNEPEPDGSIVRGSRRDYLKHHPTAIDVFAVIEVADSSLSLDRTTKLMKYATVGIQQFIIVNLVDMQIEVYEQPVPAEGRYAQTVVVKAGQNVSLRVGDDRRLDVSAASLLP